MKIHYAIREFAGNRRRALAFKNGSESHQCNSSSRSSQCTNSNYELLFDGGYWLNLIYMRNPFKALSLEAWANDRRDHAREAAVIQNLRYLSLFMSQREAHIETVIRSILGQEPLLADLNHCRRWYVR